MKTNKIKIDILNAAYASLSPLERIQRFYAEFGGKDILLSSSFGTTSAYLLHLVSQVNTKQPVHFINTGYLFKETLDYVNTLKDELNLNIKTVNPDFHHHQYTTQNRTWEKDSNLCCSVNKVLPFEEIKKGKEFWISGLIGTQSKSRNNRKIFEDAGGIIKFHPIVDMELDAVFNYLNQHNLPSNPLLKQGYDSVGCLHCTSKGKGRSGRWKNTSKTECGLHVVSSNSKTNQLSI